MGGCRAGRLFNHHAARLTGKLGKQEGVVVLDCRAGDDLSFKIVLSMGKAVSLPEGGSDTDECFDAVFLQQLRHSTMW